MSDAVSGLMKINLRVRDMERARALLVDLLGGEVLSDRADDTIGDFRGCTFRVGDVVFDVLVPTSDDAPLARTIERHGEGIDSICFGVQDMDATRERLHSHGVPVARHTEFHGHRIALVNPRHACGVGLEFVQAAAGHD